MGQVVTSLSLETPVQTQGQSQIALLVSSAHTSVETIDEGSRLEIGKPVQEIWSKLDVLSHLSLRLGH